MRNNKKFLILFSIFLLASFCLYIQFNVTDSVSAPNLYQARDLKRAYDLYHHGQVILYGPDLSGGGHLPGPFYYLLIGIPLYLFNTIQSVSIFLILLTALSLSIISDWLIKKYSFAAAFIFTFVFLNSTFIIGSLKNFWNPSFVFCFIAIILYLAEIGNSKHKNLFLGFVIGLSLQIHFQFLIFLLVLTTYFLIYENTNRRKMISILMILGGVCIALSPFIYSKIFKLYPGSIFHSEEQAVYTFLVNYKRGIYLFFTNKEKILKFIEFIGQDLWIILSIFILIVSARTGKLKINAILKLSLLFSFPILFSMFNGLFFQRYNILFVTSLFLVASIHTVYLWKENKYKVRWLFPFFIIGAFVFQSYKLGQSEPVEIRPNFTGDISLGTAHNLVEKIFRKTHWSYTYFQENTFVIGIDREIDLSFLYHLVEVNDPTGTPSNFDGAVLINSKHHFLFDLNKENQPLIENMKIELPQDLMNLFAEKKIKCTEFIKEDEFLVCLYKDLDPSSHIRINNIGYAYTKSYAPEFDLISQSSPFLFSKNHAILFKNLCNNSDPNCNFYFEVNLLTNSKIKISFLGDTIAAIDPAVNPAMTNTFLKPQLVIQCFEKEVTYEMTAKIGFDEKRLSVLAPFDKIIQSPCKSPSRFTLKIDRSNAVLRNYLNTEIAPIHLSWVL